MQRIYLDYASTTPLDPRVLAVMKPYLSGKFGNPSSLHSFGQEAMSALDKSRETIAGLLGAKFGEVIFTGSATEANNLALKGVINAVNDVNVLNVRNTTTTITTTRTNTTPRVIVSAIEHESVLETARDLEKDGVEVIYLPVNKKGFVDLKKLEESLNENTVLVSVMYANNETGVIQPIAKISEIIRSFREKNVINDVNVLNERPTNTTIRTPTTPRTAYPLLHTDAVQAFQYLDCNVDKLGVDLMTLSSHKIYGPKGAGVLYVRQPNSKSETLNSKQIQNPKSKNLVANGYSLTPIITGGGQEFEMRSGTENIPAIVGFTKAAEIVNNQKSLANRKTKELSNYLWNELKKICPKAKLNGDNKKRLPNNLNIYFPDISAEDILIRLDLNGIAISAGSACAAKSSEPSHVLLAMGLGVGRAKNSVRFSLGRGTTKREIDRLITLMKKII